MEYLETKWYQDIDADTTEYCVVEFVMMRPRFVER